MAYVKVKEIHSTLHKALKYISNPAKTDGGKYVSANFTRDANDCDKAARFMLDDVEECVGGHVDNEVLAYHVIQSFDPGETTPEQCHAIGEEFARRITDGEYKFVVATHLDRDHLHNHIIICSANEVSHRKMRVIPHQKNGTLKQWRSLSDQLALEAKLSVIAPKPVPSHSEGLDGVYTLAKGTSAKNMMRRRIEMAMQDSRDWPEFVRNLREEHGVEVSVRGRRLTFTSLESGFKIRDSKLGQSFDQTNIMARLRHDQVQEITFNKTMIADANNETISVWIPKTHRSERITIPRAWIMGDGTTFRAFLTTNQDQIITDAKGEYKRFVKPNALYANFAPPNIDMTSLTDVELRPRIGISEAQQRYYAFQAAQIDKIRSKTALLNAVSSMEPDESIKGKIDSLTRQIEKERAEFQATIIASGETPDAPSLETQAALLSRDRRIKELSRQVKALQEHQKNHERQKTEGKEERRHRRTR